MKGSLIIVFRDPGSAPLAEDGQALRKAELVEDVQPLDVVEVEVAEKEVDGQIVLDVAVGPVNAVSCIQDDVVLIGIDESADGVACGAVVPAVGAKKDDLHANSPAGGVPAIRPASCGLFRHGGFLTAGISAEPHLHDLLPPFACPVYPEPGSW